MKLWVKVLVLEAVALTWEGVLEDGKNTSPTCPFSILRRVSLPCSPASLWGESNASSDVRKHGRHRQSVIRESRPWWPQDSRWQVTIIHKCFVGGRPQWGPQANPQGISSILHSSEPRLPSPTTPPALVFRPQLRPCLDCSLHSLSPPVVYPIRRQHTE